MNAEQFRSHYLDGIAERLGLVRDNEAAFLAEAKRQGWGPLIDAIEQQAREGFASGPSHLSLDLDEANRSMRHIKIVRTSLAESAPDVVVPRGFETARAPSFLKGKLLPGAAVLAGIGLIGHGLSKAATVKATDGQSPPQRYWRSTLVPMAEAGAGVGITWAALAEGFLPATRGR